MRIRSVEPFILHVPLSSSLISDFTHTITHWGVVGTKIATEDGQEGFGFHGNACAFTVRSTRYGLYRAKLRTTPPR